MNDMSPRVRCIRYSLVLAGVTAVASAALAGQLPARHNSAPAVTAATIWVWDWVKAPQWKPVVCVTESSLALRATERMNAEGNRQGRIYVWNSGTIPSERPRMLPVVFPPVQSVMRSGKQKTPPRADRLLPGTTVVTAHAVESPVALLPAVASQAASPATAEMPAAIGKLKLISVLNYHAGKVAQGTLVQRVFRLQNSGTTPLELQFVSRSCECTTVRIDDQTVSPTEDASDATSGPGVLVPQPAAAAPAGRPVHIAPGTVGRITVTVATSGRSGLLEQLVVLRTNDPRQATLQLKVLAEVIPLVEVQKTDLDFGKLAVGQAATREFTITSDFLENLAMEDGHASLADVTVTTLAFTTAELRSTGKKQGYHVQVRVSERAAVGLLQGLLSLFTNIPGFEELQLTLRGEVFAEGLWLSAPRFDLGNVSPSPQPVAGMYVKLPTTAPVRVLATSSTIPGIEVTATPIAHPEGKSCLLVLEAMVTTEAQPGPVEGFCEVTTNYPGTPRLRLPLVAHIHAGK